MSDFLNLGLTLGAVSPKEGVWVPFEPGRDLFLPGDILLDFDPADLTTMFKDVNGTQPVTADGDSIALHLDKGQWGGKSLAQVLALQPGIVSNGDFSGGTTGWSSGSSLTSTATVVSGEMQVTPTVDFGRQQQLSSLEVGKTYLLQGAVRRVSGTSPTGAYVSIGVNSELDTLVAVTSGNATPTQFSYYFSPTNSSIRINLCARTGNVGGFDNISVKEIPGYHRTQATGTSQRKYKTDGTLHWSLYDGSDDGDVTATINWGTDEVALSAGMLKSSDAAAGVFAEFSANSGTTNATFALLAPGTAADNFYWRSYGTAQANLLAGGFAAPTTRVVTGQGKIATDLAAIRVNGVQTSVASDQGAGNFGNHILYFGRRGGSSLPFNGREYRTVIRNRLWSASEQSRLEAFIAAKSGVIL